MSKNIKTGLLYEKYLDDNGNIINRIPIAPNTLSECIICTQKDNNDEYMNLDTLLGRIINGYLPLTGGTLTGDLIIDKNKSIKFDVGSEEEGSSIFITSDPNYGLIIQPTDNDVNNISLDGIVLEKGDFFDCSISRADLYNCSIDASNIDTGILSVLRGGTGLSSLSTNDKGKVLRVNSTGDKFELSNLFDSETINVKSNTINLNKYSSDEVLINATEGDLKLKAHESIKIDTSTDFSQDVNIDSHLMIGSNNNSFLNIYNTTGNNNKYIIIDKYTYILSEKTEINVDGTIYKANENLNKIINYICSNYNTGLYTIYLLPGVYTTTAAITVNCTIIGLGSQDDVYIMTDNRTSIINNDIAHLENLTLSYYQTPFIPSGTRNPSEAVFHPLVESKEVYLDNITFELISWNYKCMNDGACIKITGKDLSEYNDPDFMNSSGGDNYKFIVNNHIMNCKFRIDGGTISDKKMISITKGTKTYMHMENNSISNNIIMYPSSKNINGSFYFSDVRRYITITIDYDVIGSYNSSDNPYIPFFVVNNNTIKGNSNMYIYTPSYTHVFYSYENFTTT